MTTMNISLPDEMKTFVDEQVARGGFSTASEYVRALLRDAQRKAAEERLEAMLIAGLESGRSTSLSEQDWQVIRQEALGRLAERNRK